MYKKVVVSGSVVEVYYMEKEPFNGSKNPHDDDYKTFDYLESTPKEDKQLNLDDLARWDFRQSKHEKNVKEIDRKKERRAQTARDARNKVRRLALSNFDKNSKFITLTFKENLTNIDEANKIFKAFIRKLRTKVKKDLKYISVIEFQDRGAIHYHMLCDLPYTEWELLIAWWRKSGADNGGLDIRNIDKVDNVGAYIVKYMMKHSGDKRLLGKKMYLCSKGLIQPKIYNSYNAELIIDTYELEQKKEIFTNSYESEYLGKITYFEYNLNPNKEYRKKQKEKNINEK